jgi:hypothetical protein
MGLLLGIAANRHALLGQIGKVQKKFPLLLFQSCSLCGEILHLRSLGFDLRFLGSRIGTFGPQGADFSAETVSFSLQDLEPRLNSAPP